MNRRRKKKQQVDYVELVKQKLAAIDRKQLFNMGTRSKRTKFVSSYWQRLPKFHQRALMVLVPVFLLLVIVPIPNQTQESGKETQAADRQRVAIELNAQSLSQQRTSQNTASQNIAPKSDNWKVYQVKNGDTLAKVFRSNQLSMADLSTLVKIEGRDKPLSHIKQGQLIRFKLSDNGELDMLQLEKGDHSVMFFRLSDGSFGRNK